MTPDKPDCASCNHWQPRYHGVGVCTQAGAQNAKMWVTEGKELLTVASFGCVGHQVKQPLGKEIL